MSASATAAKLVFHPNRSQGARLLRLAPGKATAKKETGRSLF